MNFEDEIVDVYFALIALARNYYHDERAHDLAAETVCRVLEHRACYDESRPLLPWCRAIMNNLWISTETRLSTTLTTRLGEWDTVGGTEADQYVRCEDIRSAVRDIGEQSVCMDSLTAHANGYSIAEIADEHGIPEGTVKRRIHEARRMLRQRLEHG